ncbi:MAG: D-beta-D-heptose 7-phosphate kinase / D-beta-D-heptose 1-phosphate adenosyltransferase [Patescibacteria group bacterium]|nr:D-beta-D-heptose 7-phosphate kinase / D-beta-D-heptose 1-phosphate adenosyltransferase [Patescibacteria group bacterium]
MKNNKLRNFSFLEALAAKCRERIVMTTGVFDLLSTAHADYLERAKEMGDILIVGLHSDTLVQKRKGYLPKRDQQKRAKLLTFLSDVDYVFIIDSQDELYNSIWKIRPSTLVVSVTTTDEDNCPSRMKELFDRTTELRILQPMSDEHSSDYVLKK